MLSRSSDLKRGACDPFNLGAPVHHGIEGNSFSVFLPGPFGLTEVQTAGQFTDAKNFESALNKVRPQGRSSRQLRQTEGGPQIGKQMKMFPERQQRCTFRLLVWW